MAFLIEGYVADCFASGGTGLTMTSWSPQADETLLLFLAFREETVEPSNVAGNGLTWTQIANIDNARNQCGVALYRASSSSTPSSGSISFDHDGSAPVWAIAIRVSGVDITTTDGVHAYGTDPGGVTDNDDMQVDVTPTENDTFLIAFGGHRGSDSISESSIPSDQSIYQQATANCGTGGSRMRYHVWNKDDPQATAGLYTLGQDVSLAGDRPWAAIGVALMPEETATTHEGAASLVAVATVAAGAEVEHTGIAALVATATVAATAEVEHTGAIALVAEATLAAASTVEHTGIAALVAEAVLSAVAEAEHTGAATLVGAAILAASSSVEHTGAVALVGEVVLTIAAYNEVQGAAALVSEGLLSASSSVDHTGALSVVAAAILTANSEVEHTGALAIVAEAVLTASGEAEHVGAASLQAVAVLTAAANVDHTGAVSVIGQAVLTAAGDVTASATQDLEGYQFFDDDAGEGSRTALEPQDTDVTRGAEIGTGLRTLVDVTGNAPAQQFKLQYAKDGTSNWRDVEV